MTNLTNNKAVLSWIDEMTAITKPDKAKTKRAS